MSLSNEQAIAVVRKQPNQSELKKGEKYQSRLRLLTVPLERSDMRKETAWNELLNGLKEKLTTEKYNAISKYFTFPLSISVMAQDIATDLYKVFDGRNAVFSIEYPNDRIKETASTILAELDVRGWVERVGKKVLKCQPNTVVVIDKDEAGDPILLAVQNEKIISYEFTKSGQFEYIAFVHSTGVNEDAKKWTRYGVYDDMTYRVILQIDNNYTLEIENGHDLGTCPARFFYDNPLTTKLSFNRSIPFSAVRGVMGQWQMFDLFDYYQDHTAAFQITEHADNGCDTDGCENGRIFIDPELNEDNQIIVNGYSKECPQCANKQLVGPGTSIGIEVSIDPQENDTRGIFRFIAPDINALKYVGEKQDIRENFIKVNTVGFSDAITSEAVNETQIKALVESRKKPLLDIKAHLDDLYKWITKSVVKLVYNVDVIVNANYGTEFFILTALDIQELIIKAKQAGTQATYIEQLNKLLIATEYKGDPSLVKRMLIAADVQPAPFKSELEARALFGERMITREDYYIYSNFTELLGRFERENGSIVTFGNELPYATKIDRIKATLLFYTNQKLPQNEQDDNAEPIGASDQGASQS